jgi:glycosyltransferase involved in cell wall biosynthesis
MQISPKIVQINSVNYGSTGMIMLQIAKSTLNNGFETYVSYPKSKSNRRNETPNTIYIGNRIERNIHLNLAYNTGMNGCCSNYGTKKFLRRISKIEPDIIHLHNLHNCYINLPMLFRYLKNSKAHIVWTLHDCWAFTGQCAHFTMVNCKKWKTGCYECPQYKKYPASRVDKTKQMYAFKKEWFTGLKNLQIVTPSEWLKTKVQQSFLSEYPVEVIQNGIDLSIFRPTTSDFREKNDLKDKIILLGVSHSWSERKGLDIFFELSKKLNNKYQIILVGLSKEQIKILPKKIIGIRRTRDQHELAEIYSVADYFINPSREETMGLVTVEALACGTPAIVSNFTAVPEVVDNKSGIIVAKDNINDYINAIKSEKNELKSENCIERARVFDKDVKYKEYINLYNRLI